MPWTDPPSLEGTPSTTVRHAKGTKGSFNKHINYVMTRVFAISDGRMNGRFVPGGELVTNAVQLDRGPLFQAAWCHRDVV